MIEWRWNLPPLTVGDEGANNLAAVLDFAAPNLKTKQFSVPAGPFGQLCLPAAAAPQADAEWLPLLNMAAEFGWPVRLPVLLAWRRDSTCKHEQ